MINDKQVFPLMRVKSDNIFYSSEYGWNEEDEVRKKKFIQNMFITRKLVKFTSQE